jgi:type II secretory pathway pseudopilin PulG
VQRSEEGFTLIELMIVTSLMLVVGGAIVSVMLTLARNQVRQEASTTNQETARLTMLRIQRDIRAANPLEPLSTVGAYADRIELALGPKQGSQTFIRWEVLSGTTLVRRVLTEPGGVATSSSTVLSGMKNQAEGQPVFKYFNSADEQLTSENSQPADLANCTASVHVTLVAQSSSDAPAFTIQSDASLRNVLPGSLAC